MIIEVSGIRFEVAGIAIRYPSIKYPGSSIQYNLKIFNGVAT